jgi:hypothetical protein
MDVPVNFKRAIREGTPQIFDWLLLDSDNGPKNLSTLLAQLQAVAPNSSHPVVLPRVGDTHLIKQVVVVSRRWIFNKLNRSGGEFAAIERGGGIPKSSRASVVHVTLAHPSRVSFPPALHQNDQTAASFHAASEETGADHL